MEKTSKEYFEAAELVAHCKPSKLPYVLALLEKGGFIVPEEAIESAKKNVGGKKAWLKENRQRRPHTNWKDTSDSTILALRDAYMDGVSLCKLASVAEVNYATMYKAMYGRVPTDYMRERITFALKEVCGIEVK